MNRKKLRNITIILSIGLLISILAMVAFTSKSAFAEKSPPVLRKKVVHKDPLKANKAKKATRAFNKALEEPFDIENNPIDLGSVILNFQPKAILATNLIENGLPEESIKEIPVDAKIFDVSYMVYSKWFAEKYDLPEKYIVDLDPGMHVLEFRLFTRDDATISRFNVLLDNNLNIDTPKNNHRIAKSSFIFPRKPGDSSLRRIGYDSSHEKKSNYYSRNIRMATLDYEFNKKGASVSLRLTEYNKTFFPNMDYFSINILLGERTVVRQHNASLWFKKRGGKDYTKHKKIRSRDFVKFKLPRKFINEKVIPALDSRGRHDGYVDIHDDWRTMKKVHIRNKNKK